MPILYLTEAVTGRKIAVDTRNIKAQGVRPAPCFASQYGFFAAPYVDGKPMRTHPYFSSRDGNNFELTQISLIGRRDPLFVLQTCHEIRQGVQTGVSDLHNCPGVIDRYERELQHVARFTDIVHLPLRAGMNDALPYEAPEFATFPASVAAIAECLHDRRPLGTLNDAPATRPSQILAAEIILPTVNPGVPSHRH